jgi:hypothetical protein
MIHFDGDAGQWPTQFCVVNGLDGSELPTRPGKPPPFGWIYVAINGGGYCEAVSLLFVEELERIAISEIEWGRP